MRAYRFDKDATKRLLEQEGIDSSWNTRGVILMVYEESIRGIFSPINA